MADKRLIIPENMDKAQEIALIAEFVGALPSDTYLKLMLDGFPQYCETEIENDWGMNPLTTVNELRIQLEEKKKALDSADTVKQVEVDRLTSDRDRYKKSAGEWREMKVVQDETIDNLIIERDTQWTRAAGAEIAVQELKAKLYDYIVKYGVL